jgi:hypothetical protein
MSGTPNKAKDKRLSILGQMARWAAGSLSAITAVTVLCGNVFSPNGIEPRRQVARDQVEARPFLPVGVASTDSPIQSLSGKFQRQQSTAFLVSPCYAIVDYHGVFGKSIIAGQDYTMTLTLGNGELESGFQYALKMRPVRAARNPSHGKNGLILMQLERCAGKRLGWLELWIPGAASLVGASVGMASYPGDRSTDTLSLQLDCRIRGINTVNGLIKHDCASRPGASGGPLFVMRNGHAQLVATDWGSSSEITGILKNYSDENANLAVPLDMLTTNPEMLQVINSDIEAFGMSNPAIH